VRKFLIDTDTASDDAVALIMAHRWVDVELLGITIVSGNVPVEQGALNALYTTELCDRSTPIYIGSAKPLLRKSEYADWFHGVNGMSDMDIPLTKARAQSKHAIDAIIDSLKANPGEITLVTLGPLTNIAIALLRAPEIAQLVKRCVVMGGAANVVGNVTPAAEYNIWVDPEAARIVFHSGMPIEMVGWELSRGAAALQQDEIDKIKKIPTKLARFAMECNEKALKVSMELQKAPGLTLADPVAMAVALDPSIIQKQEKYFVDVEIVGELTRGQTVVDELGVLKKIPNITIVKSIDISKWKNILFRSLQ
jgi:purine nucleosidase